MFGVAVSNQKWLIRAKTDSLKEKKNDKKSVFSIGKHGRHSNCDERLPLTCIRYRLIVVPPLFAWIVRSHAHKRRVSRSPGCVGRRTGKNRRIKRDKNVFISEFITITACRPFHLAAFNEENGIASKVELFESSRFYHGINKSTLGVWGDTFMLMAGSNVTWQITQIYLITTIGQ